MNHILNVVGTLVVVAALTTLVLPGRQTPAVLNAFGGAVSDSLLAAEGLIR